MKTEPGKDKMFTLVGKGVSPGLAKGKAFVYIDDLSRRLLLSLAGIHAHSLENLPANTVLVARRLLPSDTVFLSRSSTVAVLAEFAGPAAHAALLARELGIPCVGGIP
jgi:phosphoenolpyruvate-protein kinase (PTS system EI component)